MGLVVGVGSQFFPSLISKPRIFIPIGVISKSFRRPYIFDPSTDACSDSGIRDSHDLFIRWSRV